MCQIGVDGVRVDMIKARNVVSTLLSNVLRAFRRDHGFDACMRRPRLIRIDSWWNIDNGWVDLG
jgi:hypothetical protein